MFDIWGFLLQTLSASGVALLLLIVKSLLKDKLPPKWHFEIWIILGIMILFPAGILNRYALFNWQVIIEFLKLLVKDYSFSHVLFPFPIVKSVPDSVSDWIFIVYVAGVVVSVLAYLISYIKLRLILRKGNTPDIEFISTINTIGHKYNLKPCRVVVVTGLPSAFVCGVIQPVLVVPENQLDEKVILHELFHLKNKDTFWSIVICLLRCLHWCNPLINYCANLAINDMESRCDQFVLEQLEGEARRDYGKILLSMSNERFAKTPGSTCINNGGKNIRKRIEAIARFKQYPVGMSLVSVCVIIALGCALVIGVQAADIPESHKNNYWSFASAKSTYCTTYAGAFDTYAKAVMTKSRIYRIMCAPVKEQAELIESDDHQWDCGFKGYHDSSENYYIYNIETPEADVYEGFLVVKLANVPDGFEWIKGNHYLAYQKIRTFKENGRWVVTPLNEFQYVETDEEWLHYGCRKLPSAHYVGINNDFKINMYYQTIYIVDNKIQNSQNDYFSQMFGNSYSYSTVPKPNAEFGEAYDQQYGTLTHLGTQEDRDLISQIGVSVKSVYPGEEIPDDLTEVIGGNYSGSSTDGGSWDGHSTKVGWGPTINISGGGGGGTYSKHYNKGNPEFFIADLYVNNEFYTQIKIPLQGEEA